MQLYIACIKTMRLNYILEYYYENITSYGLHLLVLKN